MLGKLEAEWGLAGGAGAVEETQSLKKMLPWADREEKRARTPWFLCTHLIPFLHMCVHTLTHANTLPRGWI